MCRRNCCNSKCILLAPFLFGNTTKYYRRAVHSPAQALLVEMRCCFFRRYKSAAAKFRICRGGGLTTHDPLPLSFSSEIQFHRTREDNSSSADKCLSTCKHVCKSSTFRSSTSITMPLEVKQSGHNAQHKRHTDFPNVYEQLKIPGATGVT